MDRTKPCPVCGGKVAIAKQQAMQEQYTNLLNRAAEVKRLKSENHDLKTYLNDVKRCHELIDRHRPECPMAGLAERVSWLLHENEQLQNEAGRFRTALQQIVIGNKPTFSALRETARTALGYQE